MIVNRRGKSSRSMLFLSSCPIPPAPTTPSTVEARTLNSHQKSPTDTMLGATSGKSAKAAKSVFASLLGAGVGVLIPAWHRAHPR